MKKIICILLLIGICFSLAGCGKSSASQEYCQEIIFTDNYKNDINDFAKKFTVTKIVLIYASIGEYRMWNSPNPKHNNGGYFISKHSTAWLITYDRTDLHSDRYSFSSDGTYIVDDFHLPPGVVVDGELCYLEYSLYQIATYKTLGRGMIALQIYYTK